MGQEGSASHDTTSFLRQWLQTAMESLARMPGAPAESAAFLEGLKFPFPDLWQPALSQWLSALPGLAAWPGPVAPGGFGQGLALWPEISGKLAQAWWDGCLEVHRQWQSRLQDFNLPPGPPAFQRLDREAFKSWLSFYQKDLQPLFSLPQVGLTRFYQERANQAADKFHLFQGALADFLYLLYFPLEKSLQAMQEKIAADAPAGPLPDDFKVYYKMWIKILEGHYLTLLKSDEYLEAMNRTLTAFQEFQAARQALLTDLMGGLPVPTQRDLDELYREIYLLKKQLREFGKKAASP